MQGQSGGGFPQPHLVTKNAALSGKVAESRKQASVHLLQITLLQGTIPGSKKDLRYTQKTIYLPIFTKQYLVQFIMVPRNSRPAPPVRGHTT